MADEKALSDVDQTEQSLEATLYARHAEVKSLVDLTAQRGTSIPALFNQFYKFVQNPSSVSVETFKRMVDTDDTIGSGVDFLATCLSARLGRYQHKSEEITQWMNARLEEIDGGWSNLVKEILSASWAGFYVGEKTWANTEHGFVIKKLVSLPPSTILFETNWAGEITDDGILQYQRNYNPALQAGYFGATFSGLGFNGSLSRPDQLAKLGDLPFPIRSANTYNYLSIRIPKIKCVHYSFDAQGKFGNPYGRSVLRRAYKFYVMKDAFLQMLAVALDRKGTPLTVVFADPNLTLVDPKKAANQGKGNNRGQSVGIRADVAAHQAFKNVHNDSVIILPGKKGQHFDLDMLQQTSNQEAFLGSIDMCNRSMMRALLIPSLIFTNGDGAGSFALGQEHAKTFDKILDGVLTGTKFTLKQQMIQELIAYNFPKSAWEKDGYGEFARRELSQEEKQKEGEMLEKAVNLGVVDTDDLNDLNKMRDTFGFEPRDTPIQKSMGMGFDEFGNPIVQENPFQEPGEEPGEGKPGSEEPEKEAQGNPKEPGKKKNPFQKLMFWRT